MVSTPERIGPIRAAGFTIGIGMGGLFDGIVFHQILQVHNMLSARIAPNTLVGAKVNMVWDGVFHAAVWVLTLVGISMLWRAVSRKDVVLSTQALMAAMLMGWGAFNVVEGMVDHHILHLHHVYEILGQSRWDYLFLAWGAAMLLIGWITFERATSVE